MATDYMQGNPDTGATPVPFSDDAASPERDDLEDDKPDESPAERLTRRQKRAERTQRLIKEGKESAEALKALRGEHDALKMDLERLKGFVAAQPIQKPAPPDGGADPYKARLDAVYQKQTNAYTAAQAEIKAGTWNEARQRHYEAVAREVEEEKAQIHTERALAARSGQDDARQARRVWEQKYPEVYGNPQAYQYAEATFNQRKALGERPSGELVDQVMNETMTRFRLGKPPAPSASDRARMSGLPSAGGGGGPGKSLTEGIAPTPELKRIARAAHPDLPEDQAFKKWVQTTGKKMRSKGLI